MRQDQPDLTVYSHNFARMFYMSSTGGTPKIKKLAKQVS